MPPGSSSGEASWMPGNTIEGRRDRAAVLAPLSALLPRAAALALELDHPIYDCFYLALSEARTAPLVADDRRLLAKRPPTSFNVQALRARRPN